MPPGTRIGLYPRQRALRDEDAGAVLALGDDGTGKSYALRASLVLAAAERPRQCLLVGPNGRELRDQHLEGPNGLKAMLSEASQHGAVEIRPESHEARFANGSVIRWIALDREADLRRLRETNDIHLAAIDDAERVAADHYEIVRRKADTTLPRGRVLAASPRRTGWLEDAFRPGGENGHRVSVLEFSLGDLPPELRPGSSQLTIPDYMDSLGIPFLDRDGSFRQARHVRKIVEVLQRWFYGEFRRLFILISTQQGKTMLAVRVVAGYIVACRPYETVGIASYSDSIAKDRGQDARDFYELSGGQVKDGASSASYWKTPYGGGCWSAGFAGGQAGNPMTWGIIDDPDRNDKDSRSLASIRDKDNWHRNVWLKREAKFADKRLSEVTVGTRFWRGDTIGRKIQFHIDREEPVHMLVLPAVYQPEVRRYYEKLAPGLITVEPDFRSKPGVVINPDDPDYGPKFWEKEQREDPSAHAALNQQMPDKTDGGDVFDPAGLIDLPVCPAYRSGSSLSDVYLILLRAWDLAATAGGGDWTACVSIGETADGERYVLRHAARARLSDRDVMRFIAGTMFLDGPEVDVVLPQDPAAAGKHQLGRIADYLRDVASWVRIDCKRCNGARGNRSCPDCGGFGKLRFRTPRIAAAPTKGGIDARFRRFAARARPISESVEGAVDYVRGSWTPRIEEAIPWWMEVEETLPDRDDRAELKEIRKLMSRFVSGREEPDLCWTEWQEPLMRECELYPDGDHDDWAAAIAHAEHRFDAPRSVY